MLGIVGFRRNASMNFYDGLSKTKASEESASRMASSG